MAQLILSASYSDAPAHFPFHFHDCHQIILVSGGSCVFSVEKETYSLHAGSLLLISRFEQHALVSQSPDYARYTLRISPDSSAAFPALEHLLSVLVNRPRDFSHAVSLSDVPEIARLFQQITEEFSLEDDFHQDMLSLLFHQLLILLCRRHPHLLAGGSRQLEQVGRIQQFLQENLREHFSLQTLSLRFHLSASHLSHLFKSVTGQSIMEYLTACRIAAAKRMLLETDESVSRIVEACGFSDSSNFSRTFRAAQGVTPTQFRRRAGR